MPSEMPTVAMPPITRAAMARPEGRARISRGLLFTDCSCSRLSIRTGFEPAPMLEMGMVFQTLFRGRQLHGFPKRTPEGKAGSSG